MGWTGGAPRSTPRRTGVSGSKEPRRLPFRLLQGPLSCCRPTVATTFIGLISQKVAAVDAQRESKGGGRESALADTLGVRCPCWSDMLCRFPDAEPTAAGLRDARRAVRHFSGGGIWRRRRRSLALGLYGA